jgi:hypothetical protein
MSRIAVINALLLIFKYIFKSSNGIPLNDGMILEWVFAVSVWDNFNYYPDNYLKGLRIKALII